MHYDVFLACCTKDGINAQTYKLLCTEIDTNGLYDLLEMREVQQSWDAAAQWNSDPSGGVSGL
jgi:hypothetical protein